jgi:hypothetical protein
MLVLNHRPWEQLPQLPFILTILDSYFVIMESNSMPPHRVLVFAAVVLSHIFCTSIVSAGVLPVLICCVVVASLVYNDDLVAAIRFVSLSAFNKVREVFSPNLCPLLSRSPKYVFLIHCLQAAFAIFVTLFLVGLCLLSPKFKALRQTAPSIATALIVACLW